MRSVLECAVGNARRADGGVTSAVSEEGGAEALLFTWMTLTAVILSPFVSTPKAC